jgi:hypothetical protein
MLEILIFTTLIALSVLLVWRVARIWHDQWAGLGSAVEQEL